MSARGEAWVVDASLVIKWYIEEPGAIAARRLLSEAAELWAPDLLWPEVANALWAKVRRGQMDGEEAARVLTAALDAAIETVPTRELALEAQQLALTLSHPVYDCMYLALAVRGKMLLATADRRLASAVRSVPALQRRVQLLESA